MESLLDFALQERYRRVSELGDKVAEFDTLIKWEKFRPLLGDLYTNTTAQGGRPNFDEILMIKLLVVNVGLEIPNFVGIILPTPLKSFVNSLSNIRKPLFYRFMFIHP